MEENELRELIGKCLQNDRSAQEQFYNLYCNKMFSVCNYYSSDRDEARDFLQDGYVKVFKKLNTYNFQGSIEGWIRRIIVNTALSHLRKRKLETTSIEWLEQMPDEIAAEEIEFEVIPTHRIVELVNELPKKAGLVMKLYALEGYDHQEIAEILDITVGTSKSQLFRARALVKQGLAKDK